MPLQGNSWLCPDCRRKTVAVFHPLDEACYEHDFGNAAVDGTCGYVYLDGQRCGRPRAQHRP